MTILEKLDLIAQHVRQIDSLIGARTKTYLLELPEESFRSASYEMIAEIKATENTISAKSQSFLNSGTIQIVRRGINFYITKPTNESNITTTTMGHPYGTRGQGH